MKLITPQTLAPQALARWKEQYRGKRSDIADALAALGDNPRPEDVNAVIGNDSWTTPPRCSECGELTPAVIEVGETPDYESSTAWLCLSCIAKVTELAGSVGKG